jgi:drug/metabolite transporter (DMT)-like permease
VIGHAIIARLVLNRDMGRAKVSQPHEHPLSQNLDRHRADNIALGIGLSLLAIIIFGIQDAISKLLVQDYSPFQIAMMRFWAFALFSIGLALRQGGLMQVLRSRHPWLQGLRALLLVVDIWFFAGALMTVPLAELQAISLVYPLVTTLVAIPILGEKVGLFRFTAVLVGFCGALIIVRPGGLPIDAGVAFAVASAVSYAVYIALTRKVSRDDPTATSMAWVGIGGLVLTSAVGVFFWRPLDMQSALLILAVTITSVAAHGLMMVALSRAPASALQPFNYMSLPWGIMLSYTVFGHLIDPVALVGAAVIVGAGLVVMARERRLAMRRRNARPTAVDQTTAGQP